MNDRKKTHQVKFILSFFFSKEEGKKVQVINYNIQKLLHSTSPKKKKM